MSTLELFGARIPAIMVETTPDYNVLLQRELTKAPIISCIIPAKNESRYIRQCIEAINTALRDIVFSEFILVDNESVDDTIRIALASGLFDKIVSHSGSIGAGRNLGAALATGQILLFLDADVIVGKRWPDRLRKLIRSIMQDRCALWGSTYDVRNDPTWIEKCWFVPGDLQEKNYINGGHIIVRKSCFDEIGGFDPLLQTGEDVDFSARARELGFPVILDKELVAVHLGYPNTVKSFFIRELWHGKGDFQTLSAFLKSKPAIVSVTSVYLAVVLGVVAVTWTSLSALILSLMLLFIPPVIMIFSRFDGNLALHNVFQRMLLAELYIFARALSPLFRLKGRKK